MIYTKCSACAFANCIVVHAVRVQKVTVIYSAKVVGSGNRSFNIIIIIRVNSLTLTTVLHVTPWFKPFTVEIVNI